MKHIIAHAKAQTERIVELEKQRDEAQLTAKELDEKLARCKRFISVLSWELDLPKVSHSAEEDYIDAIQDLKRRVKELEDKYDDVVKERDEARQRIGCFNCRFNSDDCPAAATDKCGVQCKHWQVPLREGR